jgi:cellulose synthase/poly-beta-1,6-N-acetylglucosamine synthase-like glycosyltransferase
MAIELHFPTHNRRAFVEASFAALLEHTDWSRVARLHITDDRSRDQTYEMLCDLTRDFPIPVTLTCSAFGGPVAAMNHVLDRCESGIIGKVDSDCIVCPQWLDRMLEVMDEHPGLDALGTEPGFARPVASTDLKRTYKPARWIGGIGLFRTRVFARRRPAPERRFFGLTNHWRRFAVTGWVDPDLPLFLLDHLPFEPWMSLARDYVRNGWAREWPEKYTPDFEPYWSWWLSDSARKMETAAL